MSHSYSPLVTWTLLATSSLTIMSGATIAPTLPDLLVHFAGVPHAELLVKLVLTIPGLFIALLAPVAGTLVDRLGRRPVLLASTALYAIAGASGFFLDWLPGILVGRALLGVAVAGLMTACTTLVGDYFEGAARHKFMGLQNAFVGFGGVLFLTAGGVLASLSWRAPFLIYLLALVLLPVMAMVLPEPNRPAAGAHGAAANAEAPNWNAIALIYGMFFIGMTAFYLVPVQLPFLLKGMIHASPAQSGAAIATGTLFSALSSLIFPRLQGRWTGVQVLPLAFAGMGAGFLTIAFASTYLQVLLGMGIMGASMGLYMPTLSLWLMAIAPASLRGRLMGGMTTALFLGQFLSPVMSQPLSHAIGLGPSFAVVGASLLGLAAIALAAVFRRPSPDPALALSSERGR